MTNEFEQGDIQAAIDAGRRETQVIDLRDDVRLVVRPSDSTDDVYDLESYAEHPRRHKGNATFRTVEDFTHYVKRHEGGGTVVFADRLGGMRAVFNHHGKEIPGWRDFTATLTREHTKAWDAWMKAAQAPMSQLAFANFLEERLGEIAEPAGADLLDAAEHFRAHTIVSFRSQQKLSNGQRQLEYIEEVQGGGEQNGKLTLPERLTVVLQPFRDSESFSVEARLRWRIQDRQVVFSILFDDTLDDEIDEVVETAIRDVDVTIDALVLRGADA
ncbi:MAG: YfdQ family protein [Dehalococcoidia bacterium]|nr:YfdQ family protein [Dehalococcoidia bacterium]